MLNFALNYASPSAFQAQKERAMLGLSADANRGLRFKGKLKSESVFFFRTALRALGEIIWSAESWGHDFFDILDPVITVHPDKVFLEAFSQDQACHACLAINREIFETEGEVNCGTSNVDFTSWLWSALGEMRSSRETWFHVDQAGLELETLGAGGRFEKKVDLPPSWVAGFLQVHAAATLPGTRLQLRPVDLLSVIRFLRYSKPKTSPRGLRYEFEPGQPASIVLEPWEERFLLKETEHNYSEKKVTRLWGRRRLRLLEPLLPFAHKVEVFLKGRALPSYYCVHLPGMTFTLSLSGWGTQSFSDSDTLFSFPEELAPEDIEKATSLLRENFSLSSNELGEHISKPELVLTELCRRGEAFYDISQGKFRHRELFQTPPDLKLIYPPNHRLEESEELLRQGDISLSSTGYRETKKTKLLPGPRGKERREIIYRDFVVEGQSKSQGAIEIVLNQQDRVIFGKCECEFFQENLLSKGPCCHMLALRKLGLENRQDLPTSEAVPEEESS